MSNSKPGMFAGVGRVWRHDFTAYTFIVYAALDAIYERI